MKSKQKAARGKQASAVNNDGGDVEVKSRLQRKQTKHVQFLSKLQDGPRALSASKTIQKKNKRKRTREKAAGKVLLSLPSLADSLPSAEEIMKSSEAFLKRVPRSKSHQQVVVKETKQLASVLAHPQFQSNPFLAIQKHLINTLPAVDLPLKEKVHEKKKKKKKSKKARSS